VEFSPPGGRPHHLSVHSSRSISANFLHYNGTKEGEGQPKRMP
jgi:hypothetical protein